MGAVLGRFRRNPGVIFGGRCVAAHGDQARQCVGAVQGTLGPAQHFHLLHIQGAGGEAESGKVDAVDDQAYRRIYRIDELAALAYAADLHKAAARSTGRIMHIWRQVQQLLQIGGATSLNGVIAQHADAAGTVQLGGLPELTGDDHFFQFGVGGVGCSSKGTGGGQGNTVGQQVTGDSCFHGSLYDEGT